MMRPDAKVEKVYLYPKPVDLRKSIDDLAALVELDIKVVVFDQVLFVFLNKPRNRVKILYHERNGFCPWLKRLESERFKTSPDVSDEAIVLAKQIVDTDCTMIAKGIRSLDAFSRRYRRGKAESLWAGKIASTSRPVDHLPGRVHRLPDE
ncbi:IS66 family insertion sequence element accessory protein TnpB [Pseudomonas triticifolii]|uniref:IS66 family insertion sequence element accessory protein TnpB n=1 Tax=Pseudomonas triticifolii TaxID=2762592 RepID=A0ABR7BG40_9PSED|nr:IS66 family insertion sequence element accessory protein TnpB [Pseudomonas triticifolii]MBC3956161.1 IS66 family insertion sequence element accessory protein TnpB [Pseudomonas triticifolii]